MDYNNEIFRRSCLLIRKGYGIDLNWTEKVALKYYLESWKERIEDDELIDYSQEGVDSFMRDYFDLPMTEISHHDRERLFPNGTTKVVSVGSDLFKTPEFIKHCQDRVQMWRDERNLI